MKNKFLIIGGDLRQILCGECLIKNGYEVSFCGFSHNFLKEHKEASNLKKDMENSDFILLPLPLTCDNEYINTPLSDKKIALTEIYEYLTDKHLVFGGMITKDFIAGANINKIFDYAKNEEFLIKNALITAEGAFNIIFSETPFSVFGSRVLILGYGRIGKIMAPLFSAFGGLVTVAARKLEDLTWISANGYSPAKYSDLPDIAGEFDIIVNTVPARIFTEELINKLNKSCLLLDLASKPGGIDFDAAKKASVKAIWALSLPGKTSPYSSGKIICDTILNLIEG